MGVGATSGRHYDWKLELGTTAKPSSPGQKDVMRKENDNYSCCASKQCTTQVDNAQDQS
jgi:hypothetical protein